MSEHFTTWSGSNLTEDQTLLLKQQQQAAFPNKMRPFFVNIRNPLQKQSQAQAEQTIPSYDYAEFVEKTPLLEELHDVDLEGSSSLNAPLQGLPKRYWALLVVLTAWTFIQGYRIIFLQLNWLHAYNVPETDRAMNALVVISASYYALTLTYPLLLC
jgi:hypothetical protein